MADKKIEISLEDKTPKASPSDAASAASSQENKELEKLAALWKKQEEQDKKDLENLFIESNKKLWERQDREEKRREDSAAYERSLELEASSKAVVREMLASFGDLEVPNQLDLLGEGSSLSNLEEDIETATQELLGLVDGTKEASSWLDKFAAMLSSSASSAAAALGGGMGGGGGGHGAKAGVFGAFGGGSAGISVGHSLTAAALNAGGALAALTAATWAYEKIVGKLVEMTGGFSPDVAGAQARTEIQKIEDQLKFASEMGPQVADLERIRSDINSELRGIASELFESFGPLLELMGEALTDIFKAIKEVLDVINGNAEENEKYFKENSLIYLELFKEARKAREELRFLRDGEFAEHLTKSLLEGIFKSNQSEIRRLQRDRGIPDAPNVI